MTDLRSSKSGLPVALCALLTLLLGGCAKPQGDSRPAAPTTITSSDLTEVADQLATVLNGSYATTFAGLEIDAAHHHVVVYRKQDARLDRTVDDLMRNRDVVVLRPAKFSVAEMRDAQNRIMDEKAELAAQGVKLAGVVPQQDGAGVVVVVDPGSSPDTTDRLRDKFGDIVAATNEADVHFPRTDVAVTR